MSAPRDNLAIVSRRSEPLASLDYFPTPPWATRALLDMLEQEAPADAAFTTMAAREPCCGEGHMAAVLAERFAQVDAADVYPYGYGRTEDYLAPGVTRAPLEWVITNPPFNRAEEVWTRAMDEARVGVALLLRSVWQHGTGRHRRVFSLDPPAIVAPFCERVPMVKGRWDPDASTATDYAWFVWRRRAPVLPGASHPALVWIRPGRRAALSRPDDRARFAARPPAPRLGVIDGGGR